MTSTEARVEQPVDNPTDLTREDYKAAVVSALKETKNDDVPTLASAAAFRLFLSIFPSLVAAVGVFGLVADPGDLRELLANLQSVLPQEAVTVIDQPLKDLAAAKTAGWALVFGVAGGLWAATGAAAGLMKSLSRAYDVPETRKLPAIRIRALALCLALLTGLILLIVVLVAGPQLERALLGEMPQAVDFAMSSLRYALAFIVLIVLFAFVYWVGPDRDHPSWQWISPGAVVATVGWLLATFGFTLYVQNFGKYNATYGTLAGAVVLMLWLQLTMLIVLVGAEINAEILRRRHMYEAMEGGVGFGVPGPGAGVFVGDAETGSTSIAEAHTDLVGKAEHDDGSDRSAEVPLVRGRTLGPRRREKDRVVDLERDDPDDAGRAGRYAGIVAGIIGGGLALIFARSRRR